MGKQDFDNYDKSLAEEFASKMFQFLKWRNAVTYD